MAVTLLFNWKGSGLKVRRSETEKRLQEEGWGSSLTEEQIDKLEFIERRAGNDGRTAPMFTSASRIDKER